MFSKETLLGEITELLCTHLLPQSYTLIESHGGLPLLTPFVRIEPWFFGTETVTFDGAWQFCVETSLCFKKAPALVHQWGGEWLFRVPMYFLSSEYEAAIEPENRHRFEWSVDLGPKCFALALAEYQGECATRAKQVEAIKTVLGVECWQTRL